MNGQQLQPTTAQVYLTAEREAESDAKKMIWFFIGFLGSILGILIAFIYEPTPPTSRFLGKSSEYAALYTDSYKAKSRSVQVHQSVVGLGVAFGLGILWILFVIISLLL